MMIHFEEMRRRKSAGIVFSLFLGKKSGTAVSYTHLTAADEEDSVDLGGRRII